MYVDDSMLYQNFMDLKEDGYGSNIYKKGISLIWKDLNITANIKQGSFFRTTYKTKTIVQNATGAVEAAKLVAILGSSGSGKSTLMSVLANRKLGDLTVDGEIYIGGKKMDKFAKKISGYVYQDDLFVPTLTVVEHLHFVAQLKLDRNVTKEDRIKLVNNLVTHLGLQKCANGYIGSSSLGRDRVTLSGGERKRLSIATELITDPLLLFCDEPTTGLDSYSAMTVISVLRRLATEEHKTIICSIHQPNEKVFMQFDQIILLYSGRVAFIGSVKEAILFFKRQGYICKEHENPSEFLVKNLAVQPGHEEKSMMKAENLCNAFESSESYLKMRRFIQQETKYKNNSISNLSKRFSHKSVSEWTRFKLMNYRNALNFRRDPSVQVAHYIQRLLLSLMIGLCLWDTVESTQIGLQCMQGAIYMIVAENTLSPSIHASGEFARHFPILEREYSGGVTTPLVFYLSTVIAMLPFITASSITFTLCVYLMAPLRSTFHATFYTCLIAFIEINVATAYGIFMSVIYKDTSSRLSYMVTIQNVALMCCGLFINYRTWPLYLKWLRYVNPFAWTVELLYLLQMKGINNIECSPIAGVPCLTDGQQVLYRYNFDLNHFYYCAGSLVIAFILFHVLSYIYLKKSIQTRYTS